jgi:ABC-2 type transport system ATP-binding protein
MSNPPIIEVENLHRSFGAVQAVRGLSFQIEKGQVVGFIGANGAGKTTTMRILATLDLPNQGMARVCGYDVLEHPSRVRHVLGWMPDHFGAYPDMDVRDYLDFFARAMGLHGKLRRKRVTEAMEFTEMGALAARPSNRLSKGQTQRLCLARTLLNDPAVLILDEPAAGLDPKARLEFKNLVRILVSQGKSMLISSHILSELAEMCDTMLFIDQGQIVHHGTADSLRFDERALLSVYVRVTGPVEALLDWAKLQTGLRVREEVRQGAVFELEQRGEPALRDLLRRLIMDGIPVVEFQREQQRLEEAFIGILRQQSGVRPPPARPKAAPLPPTGSGPQFPPARSN